MKTGRVKGNGKGKRGLSQGQGIWGTVLFFLLFIFFSPASLPAGEEIRIVATTTTFGSIAAEIAGGKAEVYSIASPNRNLHFIAPTPKDVLKVKKADVFIHGGLDLEAWRGPLLNAAGRTELMWPLGERQIDVSKEVPLLEIPVGVSRIEGDIHAYGNPHHWLDPENGKIIARNIAEGLARLYPDDAPFFQKNEEVFQKRLTQKMKEWEDRLSPFKGRSVVTYHRSWSYFAERFGFRVAGELEPKPGIPPTAKHLAELGKIMREKNVKVLIKETFYENRTPEKLAEATGARVVEFAQAVGEVKGVDDFVGMIDTNVRQLASVFEEAEGLR